MNELRKRSMITRYRIQRLWTPVLLLMLLILVTAIAGGTQAQETWRIAVKLDEAFSISNSDGNGWDNPDEMYWKVQITPTVGDGETRICTTREVVVARRRIQPGWICDAEVSGPSDTVVQINVELWDYDDLLQFDDDRFDIHPDPDISVITMAYRPASNLLSIEDFAGWEAPGRCPVGRLSMRGFHGPEFARVWFSVSSSIADSSSGDSDNDGLFDSWEQCGVNMDDDTAVDVDLPAMGADPMKKDLFVEVDWMVDDDGIGNDHSHEPWLPAMITAVEELAAAPVNNPDGSSGISLHVDTGELYEGHSIDYNNDGTAEISLAANGLDLDGDRVNESFLLPGSSIPSIGLLGAMGVGTPGGGNRVAHQIVLGFAPGSSSPFAAGSTFDDIKLANFDPARSGIFRYALFAHSKRNLDGSLWRGGEAECVGICDSFELHLARASGSGAPPRETFDLDGDGLPDLGS
jgi:hypothetical protein